MMSNQARFFVTLFDRAPDDDFVLVDMIEVPNEETARYVAKTGALDRVGAAALATAEDGTGRAVLLVGYGAIPPKRDLLAMVEAPGLKELVS